MYYHVFTYAYMLIYFCSLLVGQPMNFGSIPMKNFSTDPSRARPHQIAGDQTWLVNYQFAMEHGPFIDGLPIKNDDFP